jgi:head-tail adaptor
MVALIHELTIQRATQAGPMDDYNHPTSTWAYLTEVPGLIQPKTVEERQQQNEAGSVVSDYNVYLFYEADIREADRIIYGGETFQVQGIEERDYGKLRHKKANATKVRA